MQLDVGFTAWDALFDELDFSYDTLNGSTGANYLGLALGCIVFIPLVHKFGRRPIYLFSAVLQFAACIWSARTQTVGDLYGSNVVSGLGGAISETIVQIAIADLFFVHNHATVNGIGLLATFTGAYLGPVASGYVVDSQGWRWVWWYCTLLFGINLILILVFFEESKYQRPEATAAMPTTDSATVLTAASENDIEVGENPENYIDASIPMKSYRQRLAFVTITEGSILHDLYEPIIILLTFPAITYTAIAYGILLAWFAVLISVQATYMFDDPYDFTAIGIGLMNIAPFIASIPGVLIGGYLNDRWIMWLARRNNGVYEPEMRLWMLLPLAIFAPLGILMFGLGLNDVSCVFDCYPCTQLTLSRMLHGPCLPLDSASTDFVSRLAASSHCRMPWTLIRMYVFCSSRFRTSADWTGNRQCACRRYIYTKSFYCCRVVCAHSMARRHGHSEYSYSHRCHHRPGTHRPGRVDYLG